MKDEKGLGLLAASVVILLASADPIGNVIDLKFVPQPVAVTLYVMLVLAAAYLTLKPFWGGPRSRPGRKRRFLKKKPRPIGAPTRSPSIPPTPTYVQQPPAGQDVDYPPTEPLIVIPQLPDVEEPVPVPAASGQRPVSALPRRPSTDWRPPETPWREPSPQSCFDFPGPPVDRRRIDPATGGIIPEPKSLSNRHPFTPESDTKGLIALFGVIAIIPIIVTVLTILSKLNNGLPLIPGVIN
ncbi:MAG TPA: hypothetical protein VJR27_00780 [Candidatus Saccharimonadales bacterium]|nr:hypothetical protein [Candidatus Saccharimonadales bacterium]